MNHTTNVNGRNGVRNSIFAVTAEITINPVDTKTFVLDTNVLLHDPECLFKFEENDVALPSQTIAELDKFKTEMGSQRGRNARHVAKKIAAILESEDADVRKGVPIPGTNKGSLFMPSNAPSPSEIGARYGDPGLSNPDNAILADIIHLSKRRSNCVLVTKDTLLRIKARDLGIRAEDYLNDKAEKPERNDDSLPVIQIGTQAMQSIASGRPAKTAKAKDLKVNDYVLITTPGMNETDPPMVCKKNDSKELVPLLSRNFSFRIKLPRDVNKKGENPSLRARNPEQAAFLDALFDPEISLVTCKGVAGTGKTLLTLAAALKLVCDGTSGSPHSRIRISRKATGQEMGFLPGTLREKMDPWLECYYDSFRYLFGKEQPGQTPIWTALENIKLLEIQPMPYLRGRSIPGEFIILDEAQNTTPCEIRTLVTRMAEDTKLVILGDPDQIDDPFLDAESNGLTYVRQRMRGQKIAAHLSLTQGQRSELATIASNLL